MSEKFTPGPWSVGGKTGFLNQIAINPSIGCAYGAGEEVIANARLIAAAPELLEALVALYSVAHVLEDKHYAAVTNAAAVIHKATGEKA